MTQAYIRVKVIGWQIAAAEYRRRGNYATAKDCLTMARVGRSFLR